MSRVTFGDLYSDFINVEASVEDCRKVRSIEIVPRKMVEMIIERCESTINCVCYTKDNMRVWEAHDIKEYAESLLKQFEEDKE